MVRVRLKCSLVVTYFRTTCNFVLSLFKTFYSKICTSTTYLFKHSTLIQIVCVLNLYCNLFIPFIDIGHHILFDLCESVTALHFSFLISHGVYSTNNRFAKSKVNRLKCNLKHISFLQHCSKAFLYLK